MSIITAHQEKKKGSVGPLFPWMVLVRGDSNNGECIPFHGGLGIELESITFDFNEVNALEKAYRKAESVIIRNNMLAEAEEMQGINSI